jgi:hypothetical protein
MNSLTSMTLNFQGKQGGDTFREIASMTAQKTCAGHLQISGDDVDLIALGKTIYAKGDNIAAWTEQLTPDPTLDKDLAGRWLKMSEQSPEGQTFESFCSLDAYVSVATGTGNDVTTKGTPTVINGQAAIPVRTADDGITTIYVATHGTPFVLKVVQTGANAATAYYSGFNQPVKATAPPVPKTVDADRLGKSDI